MIAFQRKMLRLCSVDLKSYEPSSKLFIFRHGFINQVIGLEDVVNDQT